MMGRFLFYTVILAIIFQGCGSDKENKEEDQTKPSSIQSLVRTDYQLNDNFLLVNFPDNFKSDTVNASDFTRVSHQYLSDSLHLAVEEITYRIPKKALNDSLYQAIHEGTGQSLMKRSRLLKIIYSVPQKSPETVGMINGHDTDGNYTFLRYQVDTFGISQVAIWVDSGHVVEGENILNTVKFK